METLPKIIANSKEQFDEIEKAVRALPADLMDKLTIVEIFFSGYKATIKCPDKTFDISIPKEMVHTVEHKENEITVYTGGFIFIIEKGFTKEIKIHLV
jgi:hypothetical protein